MKKPLIVLSAILVSIVSSHALVKTALKAVGANSMCPAACIGDRVQGEERTTSPVRGELVLYQQFNMPWIGRVIGLPGDTVQTRGQELILNGKTVQHTPVVDSDQEKYLAQFRKTNARVVSHSGLKFYSETLYGNTYVIAYDLDPKLKRIDMSGVVTVPPNSLFILGDNRDYSNDSRYTGFVLANLTLKITQVVRGN